MSERIQKVLAQAGLGSRREIEKWIVAGRVAVNNVPAVLGTKVEGHENITIDGNLVRWNEAAETRSILYHKPEGQMCTRHDPEGRDTVFDSLPPLPSGRWVMVGRLDYFTSGLLLFTTDGKLANRLMHPSSEVEREYLVRVLGELTDDHIQALQKGVQLEDGWARFESIAVQGGRGRNQWYRVVLKEGRNREIRRMFESQGLTVNRLMRIRFGSIILPESLRPGEYVSVSKKDLMKILEG